MISGHLDGPCIITGVLENGMRRLTGWRRGYTGGSRVREMLWCCSEDGGREPSARASESRLWKLENAKENDFSRASTRKNPANTLILAW